MLNRWLAYRRLYTNQLTKENKTIDLFVCLSVCQYIGYMGHIQKVCLHILKLFSAYFSVITVLFNN